MSFEPPKPIIIHVGYTLNITEEVKQLIMSYLPGSKINEAPITAIHYQAGQNDMLNWYNKKSKVQTIAYLKGLYIDERLKYAVGHFTIDATHTWVILSKGTNIAPANLKRKVSAGELGKEIPVERVSVPCTAYKFEDTPYGRIIRRY